jgi:hypothetical protein
MALDIPPPSVDRFRLHPVEPRHASIFCFALLTVSCVLASFALACATPFQRSSSFPQQRYRCAPRGR